MLRGPRPKGIKGKEREIIIKIRIEKEPENPCNNLEVIGECMWKWEKYFDWSFTLLYKSFTEEQILMRTNNFQFDTLDIRNFFSANKGGNK